jgi:hypothetical protein
MRIKHDEYTKEIHEILRYPDEKGYTTILAEADEQDLRDALRILRKKSVCARRQQLIIKELKIRTAEPKKIEITGWRHDFAVEWDKMRRAAGKLPVGQEAVQ